MINTRIFRTAAAAAAIVFRPGNLEPIRNNQKPKVEKEKCQPVSCVLRPIEGKPGENLNIYKVSYTTTG